MADLPLYHARKQCWKCGAEWDGWSFKPQTEAILSGTCDICGDKEAAIVRGLVSAKQRQDVQQRIVELQEPTAPGVE